MKGSIEFLCRGCTIGNRAELWESFISSGDNSYLIFEEEPTNKYDKNAIKIICKGEFFGTVGYVGKEFTSSIKEILKQEKTYHIVLKKEFEPMEKEIPLVMNFE